MMKIISATKTNNAKSKDQFEIKFDWNILKEAIDSLRRVKVDLLISKSTIN